LKYKSLKAGTGLLYIETKAKKTILILITHKSMRAFASKLDPSWKITGV
jgi:hypothetical protein